MTTMLARMDRLLAVYDPWGALGVPRDGFEEAIWQAVPISEHVHPLGRRDDYHPGRVRYFREIPEAITPIEIDNFFPGLSIGSGEIVVVDGHHRLIAAVYLQWPWIAAEYAGLVDLGLWLAGDGPDLLPS